MTPELEALAATVEALTGPDEEIDFWIDIRINGSRHTDAELQADIDLLGIGRMVPGLPYTASLDAAMTLVPGGWTWFVRDSLEGEAMAGVYDPTPGFWGDASNALGKTPALALCAAALRASTPTQNHKGPHDE